MERDICYLKAYTYSFKELYYKCECITDDQMIGYYNDLYFKKNTRPMDKRIMLEYSNEYGDSTNAEMLMYLEIELGLQEIG